MSTSFATPSVSSPAPFIGQGVDQSMMDRSICISLEIGRLGNSKRVDPAQFEVEADKDWVRASKKLFDSEELDRIAKFDGETRRWIMTKAVPCAALKAGTYLLGLNLVDSVDARLIERKREREDRLVPAFLNKYEEFREEAQRRLKDLYNPTDYRPLSYVQNTFYMEWSYLEFAAAGKLRNFRKDLYDREAANLAAKIKNAESEVTAVLREAMKTMVDGMVESLTPKDDGTKRRFHESKLTGLLEFLKDFPARNITNDADLEKLVSDTQALLRGVDVDSVRSSDNTRQYLNAGFQQISQTLSTLVTEGPRRRLNFDE